MNFTTEFIFKLYIWLIYNVITYITMIDYKINLVARTVKHTIIEILPFNPTLHCRKLHYMTYSIFRINRIALTLFNAF